jgi:pyruvate/2-oxoglutarate dehydrogenase complex dihydrolipoamide acyltransferase (E2) component
MISRILIPQAFENMEEATIGAWLKKEGDEVHIGDALCELITEKTTFDLPAEESGVLRRIVAPEKSVVPVGFIIGLLGGAQDELPDVSAENEAARARRASASEKPADTLAVPALSTTPAPIISTSGAAPVASGGSRVRATPAARRVAREKNIEIDAVAAAFPGKVLSEDDVLKFASGA